MWNTSSGFCFVTFTEHTAGITGVTFNQNGQVVISASLDGTVRAFDLNRYGFIGAERFSIFHLDFHRVVSHVNDFSVTLLHNFNALARPHVSRCDVFEE